MNRVQLSAKLYDCRDAAKRLLGEHFKRDMDLWEIAIRRIAESRQSSNLNAAMALAKEADGFGAIVILSAFVEMTEQTQILNPPQQSGCGSLESEDGTSTRIQGN